MYFEKIPRKAHDSVHKWVEALNAKLAADCQDKIKVIDYKMVEIEKESHLAQNFPADLIFADAKMHNKPVLMDGISIPIDDPFDDSNFLSLVYLFIPGSKYHAWNVAPWPVRSNCEPSIEVPSFHSSYHHDWYAKLLNIIDSIDPSIKVTKGHIFGIIPVSALLEESPVEHVYDDKFDRQLDLLAEDYVARKRLYEDLFQSYEEYFEKYWQDEYWLHDLAY